jgi:hypothetical protein
MKPGKRDRRYQIKIQGDELEAMKIVCADMPECFGLDRRIAAYQGTRPIGFYRWDLDALVDTFDCEMNRSSKPAAKVPPGVAAFLASRSRRMPAPKQSAVLSLCARLRALRDKAYDELDVK